jgi:hypothetical protein
MEALPTWERGTPAVLCASGPHAIPVSTAVRLDATRLAFALARQRETLRRLRDDRRVALCVLGSGVAFTAYGEARVSRDPLDAAPVVGVVLEVDSLADHLADGRTEMLDGARWRWTDESLGETEEAIVAELERIGAAG